MIRRVHGLAYTVRIGLSVSSMFLIMPFNVGDREYPCLSGVFRVFEQLHRKGWVVN